MPIPHKHVVYKGKAALQVDISRPTNEKPGTVFFSVAKALRPKRYDWDNKIVMAITPSEIAELEIARLRGEQVSFFHDPKKGTDEEGLSYKSLFMERGKDNKSWFFNFTWKKDGKDPYSISIVLSDSEYYVLKQLLDRSLSAVLGW